MAREETLAFRIVTKSKAAIQGLNQTSAALGRLGGPAGMATQRIGALSSGLSGLGSNFGMMGVAVGAGTAALGAASVAAYKSVVAFAKLETKIAEIQTLGIPNTFQQIDNSLAGLVSQFGGDQVTQAAAFYDVISAGAKNAGEAQDVMITANKLAIGGVSDLGSTTKVLNNILNAFQVNARDSGKVADSLFAAVKTGVTTVPELAQFLGNLSSTASAAGISFREMNAAVSAATANGQKTSIAVTGLQQILVSILKPTSQARTLAKELGLEFDVAALRAKGLQGFLKDLTAGVENNEEAMTLLFGSVEAYRTVAALSLNDFGKLNEAMQAQAESAGVAQQAFERMDQTLGQTTSRLLGNIGSITNALGGMIAETTNLQPALDVVATRFGDVAESMREGVMAAAEYEKVLGRLQSTIDRAETHRRNTSVPRNEILISAEEQARLDALRGGGASTRVTDAINRSRIGGPRSRGRSGSTYRPDRGLGSDAYIDSLGSSFDSQFSNTMQSGYSAVLNDWSQFTREQLISMAQEAYDNGLQDVANELVGVANRGASYNPFAEYRAGLDRNQRQSESDASMQAQLDQMQQMNVQAHESQRAFSMAGNSVGGFFRLFQDGATNAAEVFGYMSDQIVQALNMMVQSQIQTMVQTQATEQAKATAIGATTAVQVAGQAAPMFGPAALFLIPGIIGGLLAAIQGAISGSFAQGGMTDRAHANPVFAELDRDEVVIPTDRTAGKSGGSNIRIRNRRDSGVNINVGMMVPASSSSLVNSYSKTVIPAIRRASRRRMI